MTGSRFAGDFGEKNWLNGSFPYLALSRSGYTLIFCAYRFSGYLSGFVVFYGFYVKKGEIRYLLPYALNAVFSTFSTFLSFARTSQTHAWKQFFVRGLHEAPPRTDEISILQSIHTNSKGLKGIA